MIKFAIINHSLICTNTSKSFANAVQQSFDIKRQLDLNAHMYNCTTKADVSNTKT